jgi:hypothetical protein
LLFWTSACPVLTAWKWSIASKTRADAAGPVPDRAQQRGGPGKGPERRGG